MGATTRRDWYERELGWPTAGGRPLRLPTGVRFDVLDVPLDAGLAVLRRFGRTGPAAACAGRVLLLVAAGSAEEVPGLLDWLDWGGVELDLALRGAGGRMPAPAVPAAGRAARGADRAPGRSGTPGGAGRTARGAVWLRPPEPGCDVERTLPSMALTGGGSPDALAGEGPVGLVGLIGAVANACHRSRILSARPVRPGGPRPADHRPAERRTDQPCAFSYASRMLCGTRPRSLTS